MEKKLKIAIIGSGGMLGSDLVKRAPGWASIFPLHRYVDIRKFSLVKETLDHIQPDWVINTAAMSNVDDCEGDRELARELNVEGAKHVAEACDRIKIPILHISTDYVFDGTKGSPYEESDLPNPVNYYGLSKLLGEEAVQKVKKHVILRVSQLYGASRSNHALRVVNAIKSNSKTKIAVDSYFSPSFTGDLADWIFLGIKNNLSWGLYHLCHEGRVSRLAFAEKIGELLGSKPDSFIEKVSMSDLGLQAKRPLDTSLSPRKWIENVGKLSRWDEGLKNYLKEV